VFKLKSLKASGFKRLDLEEKVEFPDGRLLIHGRNESGKSTILETIHYALYGLALRPNKRASTEDLVSYGRPEAVIELEFIIDNEEYQIRRVLKRKGTNDHLLNKRDTDGTLTRVSTGARAVNKDILEILHGIDSDALLNSCLVEQKRLDNLEDSNKQERIKAMSSLLNMEAFIDAREKIRKDRSALDKTHSETLRQLQRAKRAAEDYETAVERKLESEKRLEEITEDKKQVQDTLEAVENELKIILEMKQLKSDIDKSDTRLEGRLAQEKLVEQNLEQIEEAERSISDIEVQIPGAEETLEKITERIKNIEEMTALNTEIIKLESQQRVVSVRLEDAVKSHEEAVQAEEKLRETLSKIEEYEPAREAEEVINRVEKILVEHLDVQREAKQIESDIEEIKKRLDKQAEVEKQVKALELKHEEGETALKRSRTNRTISAVLIALGVAGTLLYQMNLYFPLLGIILLGTGIFLLTQSNTNQLEDVIKDIRNERESLIGEIARITEYKASLDVLESRQIRPSEIISSLEGQIEDELDHLPETPRSYTQFVQLSEPSTIDEVRAFIQEDLRSLVRYQTEKETYETKASQLKTSKTTLEEIQVEQTTNKDIVVGIKERLAEKEKEADVSIADEDEIRKTQRTADRDLAKLRATLKQFKDNIDRKPQIEESLQKTREEIGKLNEVINETSTKLEELSKKHDLDLEQERETRRKRDETLRKSSSLKTEETARKRTAQESTSVIEKTEKFGKEYPTLSEQSNSEEFTLEAMKNAVTLLDTTRDGIMGGVKQNVEKNMMQFLPTLTDNRYNMARIDETNYRINVYDREAKQWRGKGVFSGATQDQFSLALRLAFAISTIPQSRGARPGFIFLDEPLNGFDAQRRDGFMKLVREDLKQHFPQIIVISHLEGLKEEFPNHINLDEGKIIEVQR
jgi:DNA repair protein SbcC/Rad50